ncbi:MAG: TonB-dependent receptor, partial [Bythopirellula sp.]
MLDRSFFSAFRIHVSLLAFVTGAWAPPALPATELDEIVVTAQKREQSLQEVPLAVSAFSGEFLESLQLFSTDDLSQVTPTITVLGAATSQNQVLRIRGIGTQSFGAAVEPSVSLVIDGVVLARQSQGFQDLLDIERIEVLRGPQSTLFGKNASAGVIHFISRRPSEEFEATGEVTVAEEGEYRIGASVSGPLSATSGYRLTGYYRDIGAYFDNAFDGSGTNSKEHWGFRGKLEFEPADELSILFSADYKKEDDNCCQPAVAQTFGPTAAEYESVVAPAVVSKDSTSVNVDAPVFNKTDDWGVSVQVDYDLEWATLTS